MTKEERLRYEGAKWAFAILLHAIEETKDYKTGFEKLRDELNWRGIHNVPMHVSQTEVLNFEHKVKETVKRTMGAMSCMVLHDEFGFGHDRLERFIDRWNTKVDCLNGELCDWEDFAEILKEECGVDIDLPEGMKRKGQIKQ